MSLFEACTPETIKASILNRMNTDLQTREGSYTNDLVSPVAFELWRWCMTLDELIHAFYVDETSGVYLDKHASLLGLARKAGTRARAQIHFQGREGLTIPAGTVFLTPSGLQYSLVYDVTLQNGGGEGCLQAADVGGQYNAAAGEISRVMRGISGLDAARITGLWNGPGTVRVLLAGYDREPVDQAVEDTGGLRDSLKTIMPAHLAWGFAYTIETRGGITCGMWGEMAGRIEIYPKGGMPNG